MSYSPDELADLIANMTTKLDQVLVAGGLIGRLPLIVSASTTTLTEDMLGKTLLMTSVANQTLRLPNTLPVGWWCEIIQDNVGKTTFTALSGATVAHRQGFTKTAGIDAVAGLKVKRNSTGSAAQFVLTGDVIA